MKVSIVLLVVATTFYCVGCGSNSKNAPKTDSLKAVAEIQGETDSLKRAVDSVKRAYDSLKRADDSLTRSYQAWTYDTITDKMRGTTSVLALLDSKNELSFDPPYEGGSIGQIVFRRKALKEVAMFGITQGQFSTGSDGIRLAVKFDQLPVQQFIGIKQRDGANKILILRPASIFITAIRKAHHVIIEAPFYQEGRQQLEFDVDGLKW